MRLTLSVELRDGDDLFDVADAIRASFGRAMDDPEATSGRIRLDRTSESVGAWSIEEVPDEIESVTRAWSNASPLIDTVTIDGRGEEIGFDVIVGGYADNPGEPPVEGFASFRLTRPHAARLARALLAWTALR